MRRGSALFVMGLLLLAFVAGLSGADDVAASSEKLSSPADLKDKRIGVLLGSAHDTFATKNYPNATILQFKSPSDLLVAVKTGKADAALYDSEPLRVILRQDHELGVLGDSLLSFPLGIGFNRESKKLLERFNEFLRQIRQNGVYDDMVERWMKKGDTDMPEVSAKKSDGVLVVGIVSDIGFPFTAVKDNRLVGFDIELSKRFAAFLGKEPQLEAMEFGGLIAAVSTHKIDMIASSMFITEERKKQINFSDPYYEMGTNAFALKKNIASAGSTAVTKNAPPNENTSGSEKILKLQQIDGKRIAVLSGSAGDIAARKNFPRARFQALTAAADAALAVRTDKADAFIYDKSVLLNLVEKDPELVILEEPVAKLEIAAAIKKENTRLLEDINRVFRDLKKEGTLERLRMKWVDSRYAVTPQLPPARATGKKGVLKVGTCATIEPFSFRASGILTGLDIELGQLIAERLGKKIEIVDMNFEALIPALQAGKIDFALSNFNVTEERRKLVLFSLPYIENDISVLVRRSVVPVASTGSKAASNNASPSFFQRIANSFQSNIVQEDRYMLILDGLKTTVVISVLATVFGTLLGALVCFMRMSKKAVLNLPARVYISILRGTPVLVLLMLIFYVVFASVNIDPVLVAVIAFGMNFAAYVAEIFRTGIEGVDKGQTEAGIAMGFTRVRTFQYIVLPQTVRRILPVYKGEFISLVKMTSIVGYIAVQDLTKASDIIRSRTFDAFFPLVMVAVLYFCISWLLMQSLEYLERRTDPKSGRRKAGAL